jgi:dipeptidyl aminopeptidase/acylaminoacyl peptidase
LPVETRRKLTAEDIYNFSLVADAELSPDGDRIAFTVTTVERQHNDYRSSIYLSDTAGSFKRRLTTFDAKDTRPEWSPDGTRIAFLSNRSGTSQIWMIRADGGEAWKVSDLSEGITAFEWSPDGSCFVAVSMSDGTLEAQAGGDEDTETSDVRHITKIRYKADGEGFLDDKVKHLWIVPIDGVEPRQLTHSDAHDDNPRWSPNGREIAFVTNRSAGREWNTVSEIWVVTAVGGDERMLIGGDTARFSSPCWSPDGTHLALVGNWDAEAGGAVNDDLWLIHAGGGKPRNLSESFDRSIGDSAMSDVFTPSRATPVWTSDGQQVCCLASDSGSTHLYSFDLNGNEPERLTNGNQRVSGFSLSDETDTVAYISATASNPGDIFVAALTGDKPEPVTSLNGELLKQVVLPEPEEFWVSSLSDGQQIQGWVIKPVDFNPASKYPMILQIHGGPHSMYANAFMHEFQLMAARGYVVVYTNPRGSQGYGEAFTRYTHMAWGEKDMPDVMAAVDYIIGQGYVDASRIGVTGGSYGGYMTLWIIGHTNRFKAAVTQRCVSNLFSFFGTSDIGWTFGAYEFGGTPWDARERLLKYSPITYVEDMVTPLLIVHSEQDFRCPIEQSEQVFISLKKLGRDVEFVRIPDENHNLSRSGKPKHRIERLEHIIGWFDRYL